MPLTTSAVLGGIQTATGIAQYISGEKKKRDAQRPEYSIPKEISDNLSQAQLQALQGLPEEQKQEYVNNIQRNQNFGLNAIGTRQGGLTGLASLTQNGNDAYNKLLSEDSQARMANMDKLTNARNNMAQYQDKSFELNKLLPFQQKTTEAQGLMGAGIQNAFGGLKGIQGGIENNSLTNAYADKTQGGGDMLSQYNMARLKNPTLSFEDFQKMNSQPTNTYR